MLQRNNALIKLALCHIVVIFVTLLSAFIATLYLLRERAEKISLERTIWIADLNDQSE